MMDLDRMHEPFDEDAAWEAVRTRDRARDGTLFYAVRTTGVFCRPSCPSRRPNRANVEFFDSAAGARTAGFRACLRCHPESPAGTPTEKRLRRALAYLDEHLDERVSLERLGRAVGLSPFHLQRAFKEAVGLSPRAYQDARRLDALKNRLREGDDVGRALWGAGYGSHSAAYASAGAGMGMTPGEYHDGAVGLAIRYAVNATSFAHVLVAWTARGVCAVLLGDDARQVVRDLHDEFPAADVAPSSAASQWMQPVLDFLAGRHAGPVVPLDLRGSSFQLRVWQALRDIPPGKVRSYADVARAIGAPRSARAVANACAANRAALVVPCHRVVRSDGRTGGYRWGEARKKRLLALEADRRPQGRQA